MIIRNRISGITHAVAKDAEKTHCGLPNSQRSTPRMYPVLWRTWTIQEVMRQTPDDWEILVTQNGSAEVSCSNCRRAMGLGPLDQFQTIKRKRRELEDSWRTQRARCRRNRPAPRAGLGDRCTHPKKHDTVCEFNGCPIIR